MISYTLIWNFFFMNVEVSSYYYHYFLSLAVALDPTRDCFLTRSGVLSVSSSSSFYLVIRLVACLC
jgi:hypothetical protein